MLVVKMHEAKTQLSRLVKEDQGGPFYHRPHNSLLLLQPSNGRLTAISIQPTPTPAQQQYLSGDMNA